MHNFHRFFDFAKKWPGTVKKVLRKLGVVIDKMRPGGTVHDTFPQGRCGLKNYFGIGKSRTQSIQSVKFLGPRFFPGAGNFFSDSDLGGEFAHASISRF